MWKGAGPGGEQFVGHTSELRPLRDSPLRGYLLGRVLTGPQVSGSITLSTDTGKTTTSPPTLTTVVTTAANGDVVTVASTIPGAVTVSTGTADAEGPSGATPRSGLSTAAIVGIAVGVVGGLVLLGLAVWLGIRHGTKVASANAATAAAAPAAGAASAAGAAGGSAGGAAVAPVYTAPHPEQKYDAPPKQQHQPMTHTIKRVLERSEVSVCVNGRAVECEKQYTVASIGP